MGESENTHMSNLGNTYIIPMLSATSAVVGITIYIYDNVPFGAVLTMLGITGALYSINSSIYDSKIQAFKQLFESNEIIITKIKGTEEGIDSYSVRIAEKPAEGANVEETLEAIKG